jgi:hypothetical protein
MSKAKKTEQEIYKCKFDLHVPFLIRASVRNFLNGVASEVKYNGGEAEVFESKGLIISYFHFVAKEMTRELASYVKREYDHLVRVYG